MPMLATRKADIEACREQLRRNPGVLVYRDIDRFYADKFAALEMFAADFRRRRSEGRYVPGALPSLPFEDRAFDLVLSANFLGTPTRRSSPGALPAGRRRGSARRGARRVRKRRGVLRRSLAAAPRLPYIRWCHEPGSPR